MARHSAHSATTQASSILPTESAPPSATHETHTESRKCGTSAADLTAQPPTKKANIPISDEEEAENVKEKQVKKVKKIVKGKKGKKTQKTSEMKAAEDAAADAEGVPDLTAYKSGLPVAPSKRGPPLNVPQPAAPAFTVTRKHRSDMEKVEEESEYDGSEASNESKSKENKEDSGHKLSVGDKDKSDSSDTNILRGGDISKEKHTEDQTSKDKDGNDNSQNKDDIVMTSPPVSPPCTTSKPGTVDTLDIAMISPKGSSRSEGGILRGNAFGNCLNAADFSSAVESTTVGPVKGQVWLYVSDADPSTIVVPGVASFSLKHNHTLTIAPILKKLKAKAEHFFAADHCLFVYESKAWNLLGSFETAVMEDEEIDWLKINGELILPVLSSGFKPNATPPVNNEISFIQSKSAGSSAASSHAVSRSHTPSLVQRGGISEQSTEELIAVLKIPRAIVESTSPGLQVTYQKYIACIEAISEHNAMEKNRTWPVAKATKKEIISVFVSSSAWYDNYSNFDKIANFPAMQAWLAGDKESPADLDLWGFESDHYTFLDLKKWLKENVEKRKGKGKGKSKEEKGDKDEGTSERKEKSK
ncbi:hypothetical protein BDQ17DRAFT_1546626 [Cyathus striatus]|nr:hypothetical protein BDQ17DRAFT_1546626 [Cyathus striatus]